jgi:PAS domain S-box-containing protein
MNVSAHHGRDNAGDEGAANVESNAAGSDRVGQRLIDALPITVYVFDIQERRALFRNRFTPEAIGYTPEEMLAFGSDILQRLMHPEDLARANLHFASLQDVGDEEAREFEYRMFAKNGTWHWFRSSDRVLSRDSSGAVREVIGVAEDITSKKEAEEERNKLEAQLRESQKMEAMGTLAGGVAHDINNVLTAIVGNTDLAAAELDPQHAALAYLHQIRQASSRAAELVRRILAFSRPQKSHPVPVDMGAVVEDALRLLRPSVPAMIDIRTRVSPQGVPPVLADVTQVNQVLMNLVTNARDAIDGKAGFIEIDIEPVVVADRLALASPELRPGSYVRVAVTDTGHGIDPLIRERIFEPFFTTKAPGQGTGLGLAVVHGIMKAHHGAILVTSKKGLATTVTLFFPVPLDGEALQPIGDHPRSRITPTPQVVTGRRRHILFVDDEVALVAIGRLMLARVGHDVTATTRPEEALDMVRADPDRFDLVITDLAMPGMTGLELAASLLAVRRDLPILLTSGHLPGNEAGRAGAIGVRGILPKPYTADEIAAQVRDIFAPHPL